MCVEKQDSDTIFEILSLPSFSWQLTQVVMVNGGQTLLVASSSLMACFNSRLLNISDSKLPG